MNTNQYTQKTLEALQAAQQLAVEYQHNALEPEHLLHALASQEQGLIPQLLQKLNVDPGSFAAAAAEKLAALPRVSGSGRDPDKVYISQATDKVLSAAAREAKAMKDDYVSVEHVFLGLLDEPTQNTTELFRAFNIKKDAFLQQLTAVRGNQRVTNDNPEETYNALQKYGQDLVDLALALLHLVQDALQALLELAAVLGTGHQRAHVQAEHGAILQVFWHIAPDDPLSQTLGDGALADAGLTDQAGVVLGLTDRKSTRLNSSHAT